MGKNNARIIPEELWKQAGIDKKTGLPLKMVTSMPHRLKENIKRLLREKDESQAIKRFKWNVPEKLHLTSAEIERLLYYKGQLAFFYMPELDRYFLMPYALTSKNGTGIDFYGRFNMIHPVPMANGSTDAEKKATERQMEILSKINLKVLYKDNVVESGDKPTDYCVLLHDRPKQLSETIIPRVTVQDGLLDVMSECIPYMRTNMIAHSGVKGVRVQDADQQDEVRVGNRSVNSAALGGDVWVPIIGNVEFQELMDKGGAAMADYMEALQSLDNFRLSLYGMENGGVFEKKSHELQSESDMNNSNSSLVMQADYEIRQEFCDLVNKLFPDANISVEMNQPNEEMGNEGLGEDSKGGEGNDTNVQH